VTKKTYRKSSFLQAQALVASSSLVPLPQHDPLAHKCLNFYSLVLGCVGEYS